MAAGEDFLGNALNFSGIGNIGAIMKVLFFVFLFFGIVGSILYVWWKRKAWNINVEVKLPRGLHSLREGEELKLEEISGFVGAEWGKGSFNSKRGVVWIKRKGLPKSPMKPFDIKRYLQGNNTLTVVQVGVNKYLPVLPDSFIQLVDDETGEEAVLLKMRIDTSEDQSWRNQFEEECKKAYSITNFLKEYAPMIGVGLILFFNFVGFAILYSKVT